MRCVSKNNILCGLSFVAILSFQGCDQIQKLSDYLSPKRRPAPSVSQPQEAKAVVPEKKIEVQPPAPVSPAKTPEVKPAVAQKELPANVLARVGDWSLTLSDFNKMIAEFDGEVEGFDPKNGDQKKYVLGELIQQQVLAQMALKEKLDQSPEFGEQVKNFRNSLLSQLFIKKITENLQVSDQEVDDFYQENQKDMVSPTEWKVSEIVVDSEEKAKNVLVELNQGTPFEEVAKAQSIAESAERGGDLGFLQTFEDEKMGQVVAALDVGAVSGSFKGPQGIYIVKLVEKRGGEVQALEDIREDLKAYMLAMKQQQAVFDVLAKAREELQININEQLLEESTP